MSDEIISFTPNPNLEQELHTFPAVETVTYKITQDVAARAREIASEHMLTGAYQNGIIAQPASPKKGVAHVLSTDQKSAWMEFGTSRYQGFFILRRAVESLGYEFKKSAGR